MLDQVLYFFYLLFLIVGIGPNVTYAFWIQRALANGEALPFTLRTIKVINARIVLPAIGLALVTWIAMVFLSGQPIMIPWVLLTAIFWLAAFLLGLFGYRPALSKQIEFAESAGADSDEYNSAAWRSTLISLAIGIIALMIILLFVFQPALWG
jgi:uncharacterized membrane protein